MRAPDVQRTDRSFELARTWLILAQSDWFAGGSVRFPQRAAWSELFTAELLAFPGHHDDQVDALTQAGSLSYFVIRGFGCDAVGGAGEIVNVTQVFQPSARFWAANSL